MKDRESVAAVLREIKTLPTLPDVAVKVLQMTDDPNTSTGSLGEIVERDPVIATRLLKLVNSPFYGIRREVVSVHQALMILGVSNLRNLVLSSSMTDLFGQEGSVGSFDRKELWRHFLATAVVARAIAKKGHLLDPEVAFTAGLIHDVGKVVLDRFFHDDFVEIIELMDKDKLTFTDAESFVLGISHGEIGHYLASRWNLPDILRDAVGFHHNPPEASTSPRVAALIAVSDRVARDLSIGDGGGVDPEIDEEVLKLCAMDVTLCERIRDESGEEFVEQVDFLAKLN